MTSPPAAATKLPGYPPMPIWVEHIPKEYEVRVIPPSCTAVKNVELIINNYPAEELKCTLASVETFLAGFSNQTETIDKLFDNCTVIKTVLPAWGSFNKDNSEKLHNIVGYLVTRKKEQVCTDPNKVKIYETIVLNFTEKDFLLDVIANVSMFVTPSKRLLALGPRQNALHLIKIAVQFFERIDGECKEQLRDLKELVARCKQKFDKDEKKEYDSLRKLFHLPPSASEPAPPLATDPTPGKTMDDFVVISSAFTKKREEIKKKQHDKMCEIFNALILKYGSKIAPRLWKSGSPSLDKLNARFRNFSEVRCFKSPQEVQSFELIVVREVLKALTLFLEHVMLHEKLYDPESKESFDVQIAAFEKSYAEKNKLEAIRNSLVSEIEELINLLTDSPEENFLSLFASQGIADMIEENATLLNMGYLYLRFWEEKPEKNKPRFETFEEEPKDKKFNEDKRYSTYISDVLFAFIEKGFSMGGESKGALVNAAAAFDGFCKFFTEDGLIIKNVMKNLRDKKQKDLQMALEKIKGSEAMMMPFLIIEHLILKEKGNIMSLDKFLKIDPKSQVDTITRLKEFITKETVKLIDQSVAEKLLSNVFHKVWQILHCKEARLNGIIYLIRGFKNAIISKKNGNIVFY